MLAHTCSLEDLEQLALTGAVPLDHSGLAATATAALPGERPATATAALDGSRLPMQLGECFCRARLCQVFAWAQGVHLRLSAGNTAVAELDWGHQERIASIIPAQVVPAVGARMLAERNSLAGLRANRPIRWDTLLLDWS